ncbi:MAG: Holliday junction branch migration protein RuvA [Agathobacter sp.]|uniref:Holliday junction branch migration protein RuvA n=1 Tax=Agathobacter sp. TaxID=2021311 RepID=UPI002586F71B|nr:Holliday junction branch migration protein RuvA [Agathobacter sp.]MCR5677973.1 Holliday junction branch migration protein RuvA [Agathobacter sp.]
MISYIKGELAETYYDQIVVETGGIGYNINITGLDYALLPAVGSEIKVYTYFAVREDAMLLYGFLDRDEKELFKLLLSVNGIGPKAAMGILSVLSPDDLRFAILSQDSKAIAKAPGIGAKSASRVILELKDKVRLEDAFEEKSEHVSADTASGNQSAAKNEAVMALTALGYSSTESLKAVSKVEDAEDMTVEQILSASLRFLQ